MESKRVARVQNGRIYKIVSKEDKILCYGCTRNELSVEFEKRSCKLDKKYGTQCEMKLVKFFACCSNGELKAELLKYEEQCEPMRDAEYNKPTKYEIKSKRLERKESKKVEILTIQLKYNDEIAELERKHNDRMLELKTRCEIEISKVEENYLFRH